MGRSEGGKQQEWNGAASVGDTLEAALAQRILDKIPAGVWVTDRDDVMIYVSGAMGRIAGLDPRMLLGAHVLQDFPEATLRQFRPRYQLAKNTMAPQRYEDLQVTTPVGRASQQAGWLIPLDRDGAYDGMLCTVEDTTIQRELLSTIEKVQRIQSMALEIGKIGAFETDLDTGRGHWSPQVAELWGVPDGFDGDFNAFCWERVHPDDLPRVQEEFAQVLDNPDLTELQFRVVRPDGQLRWIRWQGQVVEDEESGNTKILGVNQDITAQRPAAAARLELEARIQQGQKLESLGILAGGIAHDFNNMLVGVLGYADLAMKQLEPSSPARPMIEQILNGGTRAAEVCNQMLAYSGRGRFEIEQVDLNELVSDMTQLLRISISKSAVLKLNFAEGLPPIEADATQVRQVVMNLIVNASEAIGDRSGVITASTGVMDCDQVYLERSFFPAKDLAEGSYVYLEVADNGAGMNVDTLARVFDPFFTTKFTGRGLGLAAVLGITRGHKGTIKVYSEPGSGTTFKVLFPSASPAQGGTRCAAAASERWQGSGRVLLVDDDETVLTVGEMMLKQAGFEVIIARDGREALDIYRQRGDGIELVILDLTMPNMNGEVAFRELRRLDDGVRVVLSSGYSEQDVTARFAGKRLAGFVKKPYRLEEMMRVIRAALETG